MKKLEHVIEYCTHDPRITWLDLELLSNNTPAKRLYQKMRFQELSTKVDMFRIGDDSYDYTCMTLKVDLIT